MTINVYRRDASTKANPFTVCSYFHGRLTAEIKVDTFEQAKDQAGLLALDGAREITIYGRNGNARAGWYMRRVV